MRMIITVHGADADGGADVFVEAEPETPMTQIVQEIQAKLGASPLTGRQFTGSQSSVSFAESGLMDGAELTLGASPTSAAERVGLAEIHFVAGPDSGRIQPLTVGETLWGHGEADDTVSGSMVAPGRGLVSVLLDIDGSVWVRSVNVDGPEPQLEQDAVPDERVAWASGARLQLGASVLTVHPLTRGDAELIPSLGSGWLDYNRPPRLLPPVAVNKFRLPAPPQPPTRNPLPWITASIPALLGVAMAVLMKQPYYLLFALMSPVMMIGSNLSSRANGKKSHRRLMAEHRTTMASIAEEISQAVLAEQHARRATTPDAAVLLLAATAPNRRLWERRSTDPDHLLFRVGSTDLPSGVELQDMAELEHRRLSTEINHSVPVTLSVANAGVIGVAGRGDWPGAIGSWIVGQLAVLQSPRDLQLYILGSPEDASRWHWARWLPHLRPALGQDALTLTGFESESVGRRVAELGQLVAERTASAENSRSTRFTPDVLVVLDGARRLRALPGIVSLLRDGPGVGVYVLCLDAEEPQLPEECTAVITQHSTDTLVVTRHNADPIEGVLTDTIVSEWFERMARSLAALRDVSPSESDSLLPPPRRTCSRYSDSSRPPERRSRPAGH